MSRDHRKLRAFDLADELVLMVYRATKQFPSDERFGLTSQLRRASVSVAANIVEGCAHESEKDYVRCLRIAFASLREAGYFIDLSTRLEYLDQTTSEKLKQTHDETARALSGLIKSREKSPR